MADTTRIHAPARLMGVRAISAVLV
ncbi:MAG: hypothetical protein RLZZ373_2028, partial [Pseudomonadota bacterium]